VVTEVVALVVAVSVVAEVDAEGVVAAVVVLAADFRFGVR
jgi:hypothetical protein